MSGTADLGGHASDIVYETSILSEFGWNMPTADIFHELDADCVSGNDIDQPIAGEKVFALSSSPQQEATPSASDQPSENLSKTKQKGKKGIRLPRVAFVTKSEVDNLEDGYRWRKYGQKAVKNSSFPRSYYRCTNSKCIVKKRVERSAQDPSVVITTYEGQHCHHSIGFIPSVALTHQHAALFAPDLRKYYPRLPFPQQNFPNTAKHEYCALGRVGESRRLPGTSEVPFGRGLLEDIVPQQMRNP